MQKKLAPQGAHYRALDIEKGHLEHVIPQNKIINAYLHDKISAEVVLQMPLCMIDDGKNPFEGQETIEDEEKTYPETEPYDSEIESVVDDFENGEE